MPTDREITLSQIPADGKYGLQIGEGVSGKNIDFGASGWLFWSFDGRRSSGDFNINLDLLCIEEPEEPKDDIEPKKPECRPLNPLSGVGETVKLVIEPLDEDVTVSVKVMYHSVNAKFEVTIPAYTEYIEVPIGNLNIPDDAIFFVHVKYGKGRPDVYKLMK